MSNLLDLDDEDFTAALKHALWKDQRWQPFLADDVVDRAYETSRDLLATLNVQLSSQDRKQDPDWTARTKSLCTRLMWRIGQLKLRIKELNAAESATLDAYERKWSTVAYDLASALEQSLDDYILDELFLPDGSMSIRQWLEARRTQQQAKQAKATRTTQ